MPASYFFYDLETSGFSPRTARVMQFAGQRTDLGFKPIGEPVNLLIKLAPDVLPEPDAVMITGITPQQTLSDGLTEVEFLQLFFKEIVTPDTVFIGFNSVRFDDEFMRFLLYRNFYDAYEWQWKDGCSRWDLLDVARMTRALRPEGITWPFTEDGKPTNRLELLTKANELDHSKAHDALNDVLATIALARLIREKQPELMQYLFENRKKDKVREIVDSGKPFMYTSGRYPGEYLHTTAAVLLGRHAQQDYSLVYDLRYDPTPFLQMSVDELIETWKFSREPDTVRLPVKTLKYNRCPAVVPGVVKDKATLDRLQLSRDDISKHLRLVAQQGTTFVDKLFAAVQKMDEAREQSQIRQPDSQLNVDERLYDGFIDKTDASVMRAVRAAAPDSLADYKTKLRDNRLRQLLPLYKARNYPASLNSEERAEWEEYVAHKLLDGGEESRLARYFSRLQELAKTASSDQQYLLEELQLYGESIAPVDEAG
jgi:exodeoxyribonuclease-1